ncbi:hypothetical protein E4K10_20630 [Streptomyces sp. T1317-0309]|nr:hypothetical protein E4K10_20630 [Streptomyces sp. T1317-0309]
MTAGRYRFHDLLREYGQERARAEDPAADRDTALRRVVIWYLHAAARPRGPGCSRSCPPTSTPASSRAAYGCRSRTLAARGAGESARVVHHTGRHGPRPVAWHLNSVLFGHFWLHLRRTTWQAGAQTALRAAEAEGDRFGQRPCT